MKLVWVALGLALTLTGVGMGVGCGPEEKYCYQQHMTCTQAALDQQKRDDEAEAIRKDSGIIDIGDAATVIE